MNQKYSPCNIVVIHNDIDVWNIIVTKSNEEFEINGYIDFSDCVLCSNNFDLGNS